MMCICCLGLLRGMIAGNLLVLPCLSEAAVHCDTGWPVTSPIIVLVATLTAIVGEAPVLCNAGIV